MTGSFLKKIVPSGIASTVTGSPSRRLITSESPQKTAQVSGSADAVTSIETTGFIESAVQCLFRAHKIDIRAFAPFDSFIAHGLESGHTRDCGLWKFLQLLHTPWWLFFGMAPVHGIALSCHTDERGMGNYMKPVSVPCGTMERTIKWGKTSVITLYIVIFLGIAAATRVDPGLSQGEFPTWFISTLGIFGLFILLLVQRR